MNSLTWFYDLVESRLGKTLSHYHFKRLTGKEYEEENKAEWATLFYESNAGKRMVIDIQLCHKGPERTPFYVVRIDIEKHNLKEWLYPNIRSKMENFDISQHWQAWEGWRGSNQAEVEEAFEGIALGLEKYLASNPQII